MGVYDQERDNMVRWDRKLHPFYDIYFLKLNFDELRKALWLRYTLLAPQKHLGPPSASLVAMFYNNEEPQKNIAVKETVSIEQTLIDRDIFYFQILENAIYNSGARGSVSSGGHKLSWELQFSHQEESFRIYPASFYFLPFPKTKRIAPNWSIRISGEVRVDGHLFSLKESPGCQEHLWGSRQTERWAWSHCNTFQEDPDAVFEALTANLKFGKRGSIPLTYLSLRLGNGLELKFDRLSQWIFNRSRYSYESWGLIGNRGNWQVKAAISTAVPQLLGVSDIDTDGSKLYCYHTETANFTVELYQRQGAQYQLLQTLHSPHAGSFEVVERAPLPGINLQV